MTIDDATLLFFDSACVVAAAGSPTGGSSFLLLVCARGFLRAAVSQPVLAEKDAHVLAAALSVQAPFLITLDQRLAAAINQANLPIRALSPGEFITTELPTHPAYPVMRS
jgi:hypothetical protein